MPATAIKSEAPQRLYRHLEVIRQLVRGMPDYADGGIDVLYRSDTRQYVQEDAATLRAQGFRVDVKGRKWPTLFVPLRNVGTNTDARFVK